MTRPYREIKIRSAIEEIDDRDTDFIKTDAREARNQITVITFLLFQSTPKCGSVDNSERDFRPVGKLS